MLDIDKAIYDTNTNICKNISKYDVSERGFISQNILGQIRNFVEYVIQKVVMREDTSPNSYEDKEEAIRIISSYGQYRFLSRFHDLLQKSVSHYTLDEDGSERLMLKYYEYLLRIRDFLLAKFGMSVLQNLEDFPLNADAGLSEYYEKISLKIDCAKLEKSGYKFDDKFYIQKIKPFFVKGKVYYEVTFNVANDWSSKIDRIIAFTSLEISDFYSVKLSIREDTIEIMNRSMPIKIITNWQVSIRPCEINNFARIVDNNIKVYSGHKEYIELMDFLTLTKMSLSELIKSPSALYESVKTKVLNQAKVSSIFNTLDTCRNHYLSNLPGSNVLLYLLHKLNNVVVKSQYSSSKCDRLSGLLLNYGCIPFDKTPFAASLIYHNPRLRDLLNCIDTKGREGELVARAVRRNAERNGILFTPISELACFENIEVSISCYNNSLYYKHKNRIIKKYSDYIYLAEFADDSATIISKLSDLSKCGISGYRASVESWMRGYDVDCSEKADAIRGMFEDSSVALIYGSAGTGKTTLIKHIANFFSEKDKMFIANTHPAVENLRRKVKTINSEFKTINSFLSDSNMHMACDVLIIDECSTVSNRDMINILERSSFKLLILVGDVYQIESIVFGNWFSIAQAFVPQKAKVELTRPYRTKNDALLNVWNRVRTLDDAMLEPMVKNHYSQNLDESIFQNDDEDEIILCLNYDGLYGINNINRFLQGNNPSQAIEWGIATYKVGDPVLFNESNRFAPLIYNNMKGVIAGIKVEKGRIWFEIELEIAINEWDAERYGFEFVNISPKGNSIIGFWVDKNPVSDDDDDSYNSVIPFQVAYAISIHKAQGLEYNSVKLVITNEVEELITHNVFYTAITRAKEKLKIYWTAETEHKILTALKKRNFNKDIALLKKLYNL